MAVAGTPWQFDCEKVEQRCGYLLTTGLWSDCTFMVGSEPNQEAIQAHKLVLAMASPVFEAMFYGGLSEDNDPIVSMPDVHPEAFRALLQYIYTGNFKIVSFEMAWNVLYGAKKYMLPLLVEECNTYICSVLGPKNACQAYQCALFFDEKILKDKCIKIISTNTKEVLKDRSFMDVELNTLITVCSLDHLNVDSELDLFHAVARYAEAEQKRSQAQVTPPGEGGSSEELSEKLVLPSIKSSSQTSPAAELDSKPPTEVVTSEPKADKENLKDDEPSIREAIKKIRFLTLSAQEFVEGPARSDLLTKDESHAVLTNIASTDSPVPMPAGFSECRERRPRSDSKEPCFTAAISLETTIDYLKSQNATTLEQGARAAADILHITDRIQPALDKGILDGLRSALLSYDSECKFHAALAITALCAHGSPSQLRVLADSAALQPYCQLLDRGGCTCYSVLLGLIDLLKRVYDNDRNGILQKLRALGVPQLLIAVQRGGNKGNRDKAIELLKQYFFNDQ